MSTFEIRPFRRSDRDQLARLVNAHAAAVIPGAHASVNTILQQLEREPGEFIVDPWVAERTALVAEHDGAITAAALLVRYRGDSDVGARFRGACELKWLVFWPVVPPGNPHWHDGGAAAQALLAAALDRFTAWRATRVFAGGSLPHPGVYGVPEQWPHIDRALHEAGFEATGDTEVILLADATAIGTAEAPLDGLTIRRSVGINGTRITAEIDGSSVGYIEVAQLDVERYQQSGWADIGNLEVTEGPVADRLADFLIRSAASWLRLGQTHRILAYATPDESAQLSLLRRNGFVEVTTTRLGWLLPQSD